MAAETIHDRLCKQQKKHLPFTRLDELAKQGLQEKWLSEEEASVLIRAEASRLRSINVDEFEPEALATQPVKKALPVVQVEPQQPRKTEAA
jgi:acyl-CoA dehydrogenase